MSCAKRTLDLVVCVIAAAPALPLAVVVAVLVKAGSRGPVLHPATRVGRDGALFTLLKFRTLREGAAGPAVTAADDARHTPFGRFLRRTHLDELPQLVQVLTGRMSLVGPRPEDPAFVDLEDPRWREILSLRPGITGPTQLVFAPLERRVLVGPHCEAVYVRDLLPAKIESDLRYCRTRSLAGDVGWLLRTLLPWRRERSAPVVGVS